VHADRASYRYGAIPTHIDWNSSHCGASARIFIIAIRTKTQSAAPPPPPATAHGEVVLEVVRIYTLRVLDLQECAQNAVSMHTISLPRVVLPNEPPFVRQVAYEATPVWAGPASDFNDCALKVVAVSQTFIGKLGAASTGDHPGNYKVYTYRLISVEAAPRSTAAVHTAVRDNQLGHLWCLKSSPAKYAVVC